MAKASGDLSGRVVLVTGASRGLGRAVALATASAGAHIVATARTKGALEALDDEIARAGPAGETGGAAGSATLLPLDLLDGDSVDRIGPSLHQRFGRLDALVHCAAEIGPLTPTHQIDPEALARVISLNALTAQRLIRSIDPLLRAAPSGRGIFFNDALAAVGRPFLATYAASKAALAAIVQAYAAETHRTTAIEIHLIDPGTMQTRLRRAAFPGEADNAHPSPSAAANRVVALLR